MHKMPLVIRPLALEELSRAHEIDVSESTAVVYRYADGELHSVAKEMHRPVASAAEWQATIEQWTVQLNLRSASI